MSLPASATSSDTPLVLRREWFGGLLVEVPTGSLRVLDQQAYEIERSRLQAERTAGRRVRLVNPTEKGYPLRTDALSQPAAAFLELTRRCSASCSHCYAEAGPTAHEDELWFTHVADIVQQLARCGAYHVRLTGGEPTVREDILDILDVVVEQDLAPSLNTNGLYGEKTLLGLLERGLRDIRVSMDGPAAIHDAIRGRGHHERVMSTLRSLAAYNASAAEPARPTINVVLMQSNKDCVATMMSLAAELGFRLSFGLVRPAGRAATTHMLSPSEVLEAARTVQRLRQELGLPGRRIRIDFDVFREAGPDDAQRPFPLDDAVCPQATQGFAINAEGRLAPCNYLTYVGDDRWLGEDVRGRDLLELWHHSPVLNAARRRARPSCDACGFHRRLCNGGCPATAYACCGSIDDGDPYCVREAAELASTAGSRQTALE